MAAAGVRTANSEIVDSPAHLDAALDRFGPPAGDPAWVVKDDRPAAGKGVVVTADRDVARAHGAALLEAGHPVLLESYLDGPEVSLFCVVDRTVVVPLLPAQDFKRVGEDDTGLNTGGMGAYAPLPWLPGQHLSGGGQPDRRTRCGRTSPAWKLVLRIAVCWSRDYRPRAGGGRVQLPIRRSGDPSRAGLAGVSARPTASCRRYREAGRFRRVAVA